MLNFKAVGFLTIIGVIGLLLNIVYYILQVDYFGIDRQIEIYFIALNLTGLGLTALLAGQIGPLALPIYLEKREKHGTKIADEVFSVIINWMFVFSIPVASILLCFAPFIIQLIVPGFEEIDQRSILLLFRILIFTIPIQVVNILLNNLLNAQNIYGRVELINILRIVISIVVLILLFDELGVYALILSYWIEVLLSFFINVFLLNRIHFNYQAKLYSSRFNHFKFFKQSSSAYFGSGSSQFYNFVLTASVSFLPVGIYAIFKYTETILMKISGIVLMPMNTVFFTTFAEEFNKKAKGLNKHIEQAINFGLLLSILILSLSVSFGNDILTFLWGGRFSTVNYQIAYTFFVLNIITLVFFTIKTIFYRVALVYKQTFKIYLSQGLGWLVSSVYAYFSIKYFQSTGLGSVIIFVSLFPLIISFFVIYSYDKKIRTVLNFRYFVKLIVLLVATLFFGYHINQLGLFNFQYAIRINALMGLLIKGGIMLPIIFLLLRVMNIPIVPK